MSEDKNCFFCGSECEIYPVPRKHPVKDYRCKYCGQYLIDQFFIKLVPGINEKENKFKIACILNERRLKGQSGVALSDKTDKDRKISNCPMISAGELLDEFPQKASDFHDRALLNLSRLANPIQPFEIIRLELTTNKDYLHFFIQDKQGCYAFLRGLAEQGYIRFNRVEAGEQWDVFCLTTKCWERVENLKQTGEIHGSSNGGNTSMEWDVFICHASEDKGFVEPLANALKNKGLKVWYDRFELKLGDSLREKIDEGLANSRYGVIVLSSYFFKKEWPKTELDALVSRQNKDGKKVILPIWHGIGIEEVRKFSPILASRLAAQSSDSLESIVTQIENVLKESSTPKKPAKDKRGSTKTEQGANKKIYKGEEAWKKFEDKLSEFGSLEIPFYPFKAGKIKYWNLTGKSDICKYGAYHFSKEDLAIIKNTVGSTFNVSTLRAYLSAECNVQDPNNYSWKDILAALAHKLKTKTISETKQGNKGTKSRRKEMIVVRKPWYKKRSAKIIGALSALVLITTLLINLKTIKEWFSPPRIQTSTSKGRQLPLTNEYKLSVSLKKICNDIDSRPLVQRSDTAKQYVGIRIKEERLKLLEINKIPRENVYILSMIFPDQSDTSYSTGRRISCEVLKNQYPELNAADEGVEFYVSGQIQDAGAKYIKLSDVSLKFE